MLCVQGNVQEDAHEQQARVARGQEPQPADDGGPREGTADLDRQAARVVPPHPLRQHRPQHPAAVHREDRDEVRGAEHQVGDGEHAEGGVAEQQHPPPADRGEDEVGGRARHRDRDLLIGILVHALDRGHAPPGVQRDVLRADAVAAGGERVAELVQHDRDEAAHEHRRRGDRAGHGAREVGADREREQDGERPVELERNGEGRGDVHCSTPRSASHETGRCAPRMTVNIGHPLPRSAPTLPRRDVAGGIAAVSESR